MCSGFVRTERLRKRLSKQNEGRLWHNATERKPPTLLLQPRRLAKLGELLGRIVTNSIQDDGCAGGACKI